MRVRRAVAVDGQSRIVHAGKLSRMWRHRGVMSRRGWAGRMRPRRVLGGFVRTTGSGIGVWRGGVRAGRAQGRARGRRGARPPFRGLSAKRYGRRGLHRDAPGLVCGGADVLDGLVVALVDLARSRALEHALRDEDVADAGDRVNRPQAVERCLAEVCGLRSRCQRKICAIRSCHALRCDVRVMPRGLSSGRAT